MMDFKLTRTYTFLHKLDSVGSKPPYFGGLWSDGNFGLWELQCAWPNDPNFARSPGWRTVVVITSAVSWREKSAKTELEEGSWNHPFLREDQTWCKSMELLRGFPWKIVWMIFGFESHVINVMTLVEEGPTCRINPCKWSMIMVKKSPK